MAGRESAEAALAAIEFADGCFEIEGAVMPAIWTRTWGEGKVFVCTVGHKLDDLEVPEVRTIIERGLLWASK